MSAEHSEGCPSTSTIRSSWLYSCSNNVNRGERSIYVAPFGAVGSVTAWHRVSSFLKHVMLRSRRSVLGHYVDDFFGVDLPGLRWTSSILLSTLCSLVGAPCDPDKAAYHMTQMVLLGAQFFIDLESWSYSHRVAPSSGRSRREDSYALVWEPKSLAS